MRIKVKGETKGGRKLNGSIWLRSGESLEFVLYVWRLASGAASVELL